MAKLRFISFSATLSLGDPTNLLSNQVCVLLSLFNDAFQLRRLRSVQSEGDGEWLIGKDME